MSRPKINPDFVVKVCLTCKKEFNVSFYKRNIRVFCGRKCSTNNIDVISRRVSKMHITNMERYGGHAMKTETTKEKLQNVIREKYGVDWISKSAGWAEKVKKTKLERYGDENYSNSEKRKKTWIEKYGVDNPNKCKIIRDNIIETKMKNHYDYILQTCKDLKLEFLCSFDEYKGYHFSNTYKFRCAKCNYLFESLVYKLNNVFCEKCDPDKKNTLENSFFDYLTSLNPNFLITRHDRTILHGKELDFYLPQYKIAFEINGLYWHSENGTGILKHYHLNKIKGCLAHGIRLIHIFENEWRDKPELIKSIVNMILNVRNNASIYSRKCEIKEVENQEKNRFLNENHLQQEDKSTAKIGLYHDNILVSLMTFRKKSRFDKNVEWELSRFCNLKNNTIIGGASRLFQYFIKTYNPKSIVSYSDRRYFSGEIYKILGFNFVDNTPPSYHYLTPDYKNTINRMSFQKHLLPKKLKVFDPLLTEWENMKNNGFDRIWDCGHSKWIWVSSSS